MWTGSKLAMDPMPLIAYIYFWNQIQKLSQHWWSSGALSYRSGQGWKKNCVAHGDQHISKNENYLKTYSWESSQFLSELGFYREKGGKCTNCTLLDT